MTINRVIFKSYDIRGRYPEEINGAAAAAISRAYAAVVRPKTVVLGRDVRRSGPALARAVRGALRNLGVTVIDIGVVPADVLYFGVVRLKADGGIYLSASHNPRQWNGMNLSRRGARPISSASGLRTIQRLASRSKPAPPGRRRGRVVRRDILAAYLAFVAKLALLKRPRPLTIVLNGNFGVSARIFRRLVQRQRWPFKLVGLNDRPDGRFPKGPPNPLLPQNRRETSRLVRRVRADLGVAWDADGDRCFFFDERGRFVSGYFAAAILSGEVLRRHPRATVLADPRLTWAIRDTVGRQGGRLVVSRPGMTIIAGRMAKERARFAGEMSGHYYFRETFSRDNGFLPVLLMLALMLREKKRLSEIVSPFRRKYSIPPGEINFPLPRREAARAILGKVRRALPAGKVSRADGLSIEYPRWRFNLRPSNTEALLRLNVEAKDPRTLRRRVAQLSKVIRTA